MNPEIIPTISLPCILKPLKIKHYGLLYSLLVGGVAGWLAGKLMKGGGFGLILNIVLGIVGGLLAGWLFGKFGIHLIDGVLGDILKGFIGATLILLIVGLFKKK